MKIKKRARSSHSKAVESLHRTGGGNFECEMSIEDIDTLDVINERKAQHQSRFDSSSMSFHRPMSFQRPMSGKKVVCEPYFEPMALIHSWCLFQSCSEACFM